MKILVLWADHRSANLGVRVLADGAAHLAREAWGEECTIDFLDFGESDDGFLINRKLIARDLLSRRSALRERLSSYDVVLDTGAGDSFADIYGLDRLVRVAYVAHRLQRMRILRVLTPQTIGPFHTRLGEIIGRMALKSADLIMARDSTSARVSAEMGRTVDALSTDVVFALPQPSYHEIGYDIVLNVSGLLWNTDAHIDSQAYRAETRTFITQALQRGRKIHLLPHVLGNDSQDSDIAVSNGLAEEFGLAVADVSDTLEAREIISSASALVGARMHACLNAISVGTPAVPWAYSRKFEPLMRDLNWTHTVDLSQRSDWASQTIAKIEDFASPEGGVVKELEVLRETARMRLDAAVERLQSLQVTSAGTGRRSGDPVA